MAEFAKYYLDFLYSLWQNLVAFFSVRLGAIGHIFSKDLGGYFSQLTYAARDFGFWGWMCLIVVTLINATLVFFVSFRVFLMIRRFVVFRAGEVKKDELVEEIAILKEQVDALTKEKTQILSLKLGEIGGGTINFNNANYEGIISETGTSETKTEIGVISRFTKLVNIDNKYRLNPVIINMKDEDTISLSKLVDRFVNFAASQLKLYYNKDVVRRYFAGLATTKVIIIEGISGTGKTSLPYAMGKFFNNDSKIISVQPSWRDRSELLGYLNEFTKKFNETDFLSGLYEATYREDLNFMIIDEMNLARIEYYFAEFLSIMEMPDITEWKIDIVPSSDSKDPRNLVNGKLLVPQNIWFVGTANQDDSTFTITDKVYDRAISIELNNRCDYFDAPLTKGVEWSYDYLDMLFRKCITQNPISAEITSALNTIDIFIQDKFRISFGNRILKQLGRFIPIFVSCGGTEVEGFDFILQSKVLRKFNSLNLAFLSKEINELVALLEKIFGKGKMPISVEYLKRLQKNA